MHAPNVLRVNWCQFDDLVDRLSRAVLLDGAPQVIVAIQRGGLIPGVCLSHRLATRALVPFECATTINDDIGADKVFPTFREMGDLDRIEGKDVLLVDDIVGSGATLRGYRSDSQVQAIAPEITYLLSQSQQLGVAGTTREPHHLSGRASLRLGCFPLGRGNGSSCGVANGYSPLFHLPDG